MKYRKLGRTNFDVSEIGYGAWGIGGSMWIGASDKESLAALRFALDQGVKSIVTMVSDYGPGVDAETAFVKAFEAGGGKVAEKIRVPLKTTDFAPFAR